MRSQELEAHLQCRHQLQILVRSLLLIVLFGQTPMGRTCKADGPKDPYRSLCDVLMTRIGADGKSYGKYETSPAIWPSSEFPFDEKTFPKFNAALNEFTALPNERIEAYSDLQRAILQRHLWKVFDHRPRKDLSNVPESSSVLKRRATAEPKIALLIKRLALSEKKIVALPDTLSATIKSKKFSERFDSEKRFKPFLPAKIYSKKSPWVCLGEVDSPIPANQHATKSKWRSAFHSFIRVPGSRKDTLECIEKFNRSQQLPAGTQFALIERAFLISDKGELVLSPLTVSVSLRAYVDLVQDPRTKRFRVMQSVAEFVLQPSQLIEGNVVMRALGPSDYRFDVDDVGATGGLTGVDDPFESDSLWLRGRLTRCMSCHGQSRIQKPKTIIGLRTARSGSLQEGDPSVISRATATRKQRDDSWKMLRKFLLADSTTK